MCKSDHELYSVFSIIRVEDSLTHFKILAF